MAVEDICDLAVVDYFASDAVLFLWVPSPKLPDGLTVMKAWGFTYKTSLVWDKVTLGLGYWVRGRHEFLLIGTKGKMSPPPVSLRLPSVFSSKRKKHSEKPDEIRDWISKCFPESLKVELFARVSVPGWDSFGDEMPQPTTLITRAEAEKRKLLRKKRKHRYADSYSPYAVDLDDPKSWS